MSKPDAPGRCAAERASVPRTVSPYTGFVGNPGSSKIGPQQLDRLAVVYIRQSSPQQVLDHRESRARQYALADYAQALGWPRERILVIDEDQGQTATTAEQRRGFQRLVTEVTLKHVGLILGLEMSRLCRSNRDWAYLSDVCGVFDTLLGDQDGIYDPNDVNDRMVLGLKGILSEMELTMMRNRLERGRQHKAARGELFQRVPIGYVKLPNGQVALDPDEQVRAVVSLVFDKYDELGSVYALWHYLLRHQICLGVRLQEGPRRGQLEWHWPRTTTLYAMLHHPMYAGAYVFGRRRRQRRRSGVAAATEPVLRNLPMSEWQVLLRDRVPAYITWERYEANRQRLQQHRSSPDSPGSVRQGTALLSGLLVCGRCGRRLQISYKGGRKSYYSCLRHHHDPNHPRCPGLGAGPIDHCVAEQVLHALEPAALALSLQALHDLEEERRRLDQHWQQRLQRAHYETQRAERQYHSVEPENRLVARTLEQRWEEALQAQRQLQEEYDRLVQAQPPRLTEAERARVQTLAQDIPALWQAPRTTPADKKEIIRCVVDKVVVTIAETCVDVGVAIHWKGGQVTQHRCQRRIRSYADLPNREELLRRVVYWRQRGCTAAGIATKLTEEGFRPPKRRDTFTGEMALDLLHACGLGAEHHQADLLAKQEWQAADLARHLGIDPKRMNVWIQRGWVQARRTPIAKRWLVWADARELRRLRKLAVTIPAAPGGRPDPTLTKPGKRTTK
jgi:DNA invertase Pin-like site-specific DNA recombinase